MNARTVLAGVVHLVILIASAGFAAAGGSPKPAKPLCEVHAGDARILVKGQVLTPEAVIDRGQVLIAPDGTIACVGTSCRANGATEIACRDGVVSPGLVNAHDHLTFDHNPPHVQTAERYEHRHDWRLGLRGHTQIIAPGGGSTQQQQWTELRFVMAGATSTIGAGGSPGLLRNLDVASRLEGLAGTAVAARAFPLDDSSGIFRTADCDYGTAPDAALPPSGGAYLPHVAEGIDHEAQNEFRCLTDASYDTTPQAGGGGTSANLLSARTAIVGGVGLDAADFAAMAANDTKLVWSPRSNVALYGNTSPVTAAARAGVTIALGTDWLVSGSMNVLRELQCADQLNRNHLAGFFDDRDLWRMATVNAAAAAGLAGSIGAIAVGRVADIAIFDGRTHAAWRAVIDAEPKDVALVLRGGVPLYGDRAVLDGIAGTASCDAVSVCGIDKRVCVSRETGLSLGALASLNGGAYPLFFCGVPADEPSCTPTRAMSVGGSTIYSGVPTASDADGDGVADAFDDCPATFDPVRPMDVGIQSDSDGDGIGDVCDLAP